MPVGGVPLGASHPLRIVVVFQNSARSLEGGQPLAT